MVEATGVRIGWKDLPGPVRNRVEEIIGGGPVVTADSQPGGFSPGTADRVRTASGARAFVKAISPALNEVSAALGRQELRICAALPEHAPAPRMLGGFDDGEWVVLVLEDVAGAHPRTPWVEGEISAAATALRNLAAVLTPAPLAGLPTVAERYRPVFSRWADLAAAPPGDLDPWAARNLGRLHAAALDGIAAMTGGQTLAHTDLRADNILIRPDGRLVFIDWPWGSVGPRWLDAAFLAINVIVHGGDPGPLLTGLDRDAMVGIVAGSAAAFQHTSRLPPPPGLPTVRAFQRFQGDALLPWLRDALDGGAPPSPKRG